MTENPQQFTYMLLSRLQSDCNYYFNHGCGLWGVTPESHANKMVELYKALKIKPEWLPLSELKELYYKLTNKELKL